MNASRICKLIGLPAAMCLALTVGCKDLTSQNATPGMDRLSTKTPGTSQTGGSLHADGERPANSSPAGIAVAAGASSDALPSDAVSPGSSPTVAAQVGAAQSGSTQPAAAQPGKSPSVAVPDQLVPKQSIALPAVKPDEIYEPRVVMSRAHEQTCLIKVGDVMPNLALQSLTGEPVSLDDLRGDKLTVVVFWSNRFAFGRAQFQHLAAEVALPFRHLGVKVVAVNVGDPVEQIELDAATKDEVVSVLDPDGSATAKVATGKLPRTYLIDRAGRVLWFDIEYSRAMRRQLKNAIFYCSGEVAAAAS